jgi:signal transduction histidine kinase
VQGATGRSPWSEPGAALEIEILPPLWSTAWFRAAFGGFILLLVWALYQARLRQITEQYNIRVDERVGERTRIARELHDTLLQSFHGLILRFQAVHNMLPDQPIQAKDCLGIAIDRAAEAITEGRDAVQELRGSGISGSNLVQALTSLGRELGANGNADASKASTTFGVLVEGTPRRVHPLLQDDLYRIACEAVGNAFRHARASRIEVEIRYDERMFRLRVRDDGEGMDPHLLAQGGREGHWGLRGMRERARSIGGGLEVWSELHQGTEVEVTIPGSVAYRHSVGHGNFRDSGDDR